MRTPPLLADFFTPEPANQFAKIIDTTQASVVIYGLIETAKENDLGTPTAIWFGFYRTRPAGARQRKPGQRHFYPCVPLKYAKFQRLVDRYPKAFRSGIAVFIWER